MDQILYARTYARQQGVHKLENPHAMIGRQCKCGTCFCCAANFVVKEIKSAPKPIL